MQLTLLSNKSYTEYTEANRNKSLRGEMVYDKCDLKGILIDYFQNQCATVFVHMNWKWTLQHTIWRGKVLLSRSHDVPCTIQMYPVIMTTRIPDAKILDADTVVETILTRISPRLLNCLVQVIVLTLLLPADRYDEVSTSTTTRPAIVFPGIVIDVNPRCTNLRFQFG